MPEKEWMKKYESVRDKLVCKTDLDAYFTEKVIGNTAVDVLEIGTVRFPTGTIFALRSAGGTGGSSAVFSDDPCLELIPVKICVVPSERYGDRYACVKVEITREKPVRYELGMTGAENLEEELSEEDFFGFGVDAGMGCIADIPYPDGV